MKHVFNIGAAIASMLAFALVFSWIWQWHIVPMGAPHVGPAHAIGISALKSLTFSQALDWDRMRRYEEVPRDERTKWETISSLAGVGMSLVCLGIAFLAKLAMG